MKRADGEIVATPEEGNKGIEASVVEPRVARSSLVAAAAEFLTTVAIRAAQNHTGCRLEESLSSRPRPRPINTASVPPDGDSSVPASGLPRIERVDGDFNKPGSVLLVGGSR
jgi:hypothetical protein